MTTGSRRVLLYWLLLLLPTLAVGAGALWLLQREKTRLDERAQAAVETRRGAIAERARLIAENVELLVGDAETGLMTTLQQTPIESPSAFLEEWERTNALVRSTFVIDRAGNVVRPATENTNAGSATTWLRTWLAAGAPWNGSQRQVVMESDADQRLRQDVSSNVSKVQSARSAIKDAASQKNSLARMETAARPEKVGWQPWRDGANLHLIGWRQTSRGDVIGVDVKLQTIIERTADLFPKDGALVDALTLRDAAGTTLQKKVYGETTRSSSRSATDTPDVRVPISTAVLPGWEVAGYARDIASGREGNGVMLTGALLVAILVAAIMAGGSLLLMQARQSEAEAAQKTSFVANVSHEFKTPLTTIRLYSELLEQGRVRDAAQQNDYLRTIGRETERLARLVNNALDFSRLEQGQRTFSRESVDLADALMATVSTHAPRIAEAGLTLRTEMPTTPVLIETDRDAVGQIVLNLIDNACKYAGAGGEITLTLAAASSGAQVRVLDRGPGVPVSHRERIFDKFHRVDNALTAAKTGAGLGLSIARQLARGLGGDLRFEPRDGGGAAFILTLP